jgi:hypothetical protein
VAITAITLTDPDSGTSCVLCPRDGIAWQGLDAAASARAATADRVAAHGTVDTTRYLSDAAVSLALTLYQPAAGGSMRALWDEIAALLDPALRPLLIVDDDEWDGPRQITVRFDSATKPRGDTGRWNVQVSWRAPDPVWESVAQAEYVMNVYLTVFAGVMLVASDGARVTDHGLYCTPQLSAPSARITNGSQQAHWQARLYGPCSAPKLRNLTAGASLGFTGSLVLGPGDFVLLDSRSQTAVRASDGADVTSWLDFGASDWWTLARGDSYFRYTAQSASAGAAADITFRAAYMA